MRLRVLPFGPCSFVLVVPAFVTQPILRRSDL